MQPNPPFTQTLQAPCIDSADVVVIGAGPGGIGAAVMAARQGVKTLLIERYGHPGGMAASGEVHPFMSNHVEGQPLDRPIYTDWVARMPGYLPAGHPFAGQGDTTRSSGERMIDKHLAALAAEDLCLEAGVSLRYHHTLVDVVREDRCLSAALVHSKGGFGAITGRVFIDASGDADLAAAAGCRFEIGGPSGHCQPMTLCFKLGGVDRERVPAREWINHAYDEARQRGEIDCPRENVLKFNWIEPDVVHFNTTRIIQHSAVEGRALSDAEILGRRQLRQFLAFFQRHVPGFERATLLSMAHHIGVRESRRVMGRVYLEREAFTERRKCPDAIARVRYDIDIHNPNGTGTEIERLPPGEWYEVPYGCIVAADLDNLLIGGRPVSVDHAIHSSLRIMPVACSLGQAAGMAAAMAVRAGCAPSAIPGEDVRAALRDAGAFL